MNGFMSVKNGLPKDDDRAMFLDVRVSEKELLEEFSEVDEVFNYARFYRDAYRPLKGRTPGYFTGVALPSIDTIDCEYPWVCFEIELKTVTHWRYIE